MRFEIGLTGDVHLLVPLKDIPKRAQVDMLRALMRQTGYAEALYKGVNKKVQEHLDQAWEAVNKYRESE